jgi:hypothetical protein
MVHDSCSTLQLERVPQHVWLQHSDDGSAVHMHVQNAQTIWRNGQQCRQMQQHAVCHAMPAAEPAAGIGVGSVTRLITRWRHTR